MTVVIKRLRQIVIFIVGIIVVILGFILIPLPGPGLLVVLLGLIILSTEFAWARSYKDRLKAHFRNAVDKIKEASVKHDDQSK